MLISICAPCHNRTYDLKKSLPTWIAAANASPPVEIIVLDYNSPDDLQDYIKDKEVLCPKYTGRDYYHMAHARNLSILETKGKYFIQLGVDNQISLDFIPVIRDLISRYDLAYITVHKNEGVVVLPKSEFIKAGGYDERFEFYSPEDKDLYHRLIRRGFSPLILGGNFTSVIHTPDEEKIKNYRLPLSKRDMAKAMSQIYHENMKNNVMVANEGKEWGKWI